MRVVRFRARSVDPLIVATLRNQFAETRITPPKDDVVVRPTGSLDRLNWRVPVILGGLLLWFFAALIIPIPRTTNAGDEAAARILGFVSGATCWLLLGAVVHVLSRRWTPQAGLTVITLGICLAAGSNVTAAVAPFAPTPVRGPITEFVASAEAAIRNSPETILRTWRPRPALAPTHDQPTGLAEVPTPATTPEP